MARVWHAKIKNTDSMKNQKNGKEKLTPAERVDEKLKKDDVTGQTASTVKEMKSRQKEVPHTSAATKHDKEEYTKKANHKKASLR
jgi:hypothetical protein